MIDSCWRRKCSTEQLKNFQVQYEAGAGGSLQSCSNLSAFTGPSCKMYDITLQTLRYIALFVHSGLVAIPMCLLLVRLQGWLALM